MAKLNVSGAFLITIGHGSGPETSAVVSIATEDGEPVSLDPKESVRCFVALSAMFGDHDIPLKIVDVETMPAGFYGLRLETAADMGVPLGEMAPATIGVVVEHQGDRGQALACSCTAARESRWWARAKMARPRKRQ